MFVSKVDPAVLTSRLDAEHYEPELLRIERNVLNCGLNASCLDEIRVPEATITYGIVQPGNLVAPGQGVRLIRCTDLGDLSVAFDNLIWVSHEVDQPYRRSRVLPGDVLIGIAGSLGVVGIAPLGITPANLNQSVARVRCRTLSIGGWTASYLASKYGQAVLARRAVGAVQQHLNLADLPDVPLPVPRLEVCEYIGCKIDQAAKLREWARGAEVAFQSAVAISVPNVTVSGRQSRVEKADLDTDLNPGRFTPDRLAVRRVLTQNGARRVEIFASIASVNISEVSPKTRYLGLDGISQTSIDLTLQTVEQAGVSGTCRVLRRGAAISKLRPYLNKATFIPEGQGRIVGSTELLNVESTMVHPGFIYGVLKLDTTLRQLNPVASGATHPRVGGDDILELLVPWHPEHERLGRSLELAQAAYFAARALVTTARLLVEALIERKVSEAELIAAGKSADADRALLARIAEDGLDGPGDLLFPDLDGLADLLAEISKEGAS